jgi:hypothetical protein
MHEGVHVQQLVPSFKWDTLYYSKKDKLVIIGLEIGYICKYLNLEEHLLDDLHSLAQPCD